VEPNAEVVRTFLRKEISRLALVQPELNEIDDTFSLIDSGALDSVGFVALLTSIQARFDVDLQFSGADPDEFTTLGGLIHLVLHSVEKPMNDGRHAA
jgi:acyl carrier protein